MAVRGGYAYLAGGANGLLILDIKNPEDPHEVSVYDTDFANGVAVQGAYAYVADREGGLQIIDIGDPYSPKHVGTADTTYAWGVAVQGAYAYLADFSGGFRVIKFSAGRSRIGAHTSFFTGNVGIGTTEPRAKLEVRGSFIR